MTTLFDLDAFKSVNPVLIHPVKENWRMPPAPYDGTASYWVDDNDSPEDMVFVGFVNKDGDRLCGIPYPLKDLGSLNEQCHDLEILGFEYRSDLNWRE